MHPPELHDQFIALRAKNVPYDDIAKQLQISKGIAVKWGTQFAAQIKNLRVIELEALQHRLLGDHEQQFGKLVHRLLRLESEIDRRKVEYMPTRELLRVLADTRNQLDSLRVEPVFVEEPSQPASNS